MIQNIKEIGDFVASGQWIGPWIAWTTTGVIIGGGLMLWWLYRTKAHLVDPREGLFNLFLFSSSSLGVAYVITLLNPLRNGDTKLFKALIEHMTITPFAVTIASMALGFILATLGAVWWAWYREPKGTMDYTEAVGVRETKSQIERNQRRQWWRRFIQKRVEVGSEIAAQSGEKK